MYIYYIYLYEAKHNQIEEKKTPCLNLNFSSRGELTKEESERERTQIIRNYYILFHLYFFFNFKIIVILLFSRILKIILEDSL